MVLLSSLFTITRFFEAEVISEGELEGNDKSKVSNNTLYLHPTELRLHPSYIKYYNWSRLIVHGLVPFVMLVYLNGLMYKDIKARRKNWEYRDNNSKEITTTDVVLFNGTTAHIVEESARPMQNDCCEIIKEEIEQTRLV